MGCHGDHAIAHNQNVFIFCKQYFLHLDGPTEQFWTPLGIVLRVQGTFHNPLPYTQQGNTPTMVMYSFSTIVPSFSKVFVNSNEYANEIISI